MIYKKPEDELWDVIKTQKTIRTGRLAEIAEPLLKKMEWQEQALADNVKSIRALNDRAQRAEQQLKDMRRHKADVDLERRIAENLKDEGDW